MSMARFLVVGVLVLAALAVWAEQVTLTRTVLLPNGRPAAVATVLVRRYNPASETQVTTNAQGQFNAMLDYTPPKASHNEHPFDVNDGYFLINMPGYALHFALYNLEREKPPVVNKPMATYGAPGAFVGDEQKTVRLTDYFEITGMVTDADKQPAVSAGVYVVALTTGPYGTLIPVNAPGMKISTPILIAKTGTDGRYRLRGITATFSTGGFSMGMPTVVGGPVLARLVALSADNTRAGETDNGIFIHPAAMRPEMAACNNLTLSPTVTLEGRVTNAATGAPEAGVQVTLRGAPGIFVGCLPPAVTDKDGKYRFATIPVYERKLFTLCSAQGLSEGWAYAYNNRTPITKPLTGIDMTVRPWVDVKGTVIDVATKQAPLVPIDISVTYDEGWRDEEREFNLLGYHTNNCQVNADGTFTLHVPTGNSSLRIYGAGYSGTDNIAVKLQDNAPLALTVKRQYGMLIRFVSDRTIDWSTCNLQTRNDNVTITPSNNDSDFRRYGVMHFGSILNHLQVRITQRNGSELLPWTPVVADPKTWLYEVRIP